RLLYECNPLAFIVEQAGGKATNGKQRILEIQPTELHQRTPILIGNTEMVEKVEEFIRLAEAREAKAVQEAEVGSAASSRLKTIAYFQQKLFQFLQRIDDSLVFPGFLSLFF